MRQGPINEQIYLDNLAAQGLEAPSQPEPMKWARRLRRFNFTHLYYGGGYQSQPYIWLMEIEMVFEAEIEYENLKITNKRLQQQMRNQFRTG